MLKRYVLRSFLPAQATEWDRFITEHARGHFLQSWGWGDLKAGFGWKPLRLALCEPESGKMLAAAQVLQRGGASFATRLGHLAYIPKGPVLDWTASVAGVNLGHFFLTKVRQHMRGQGALALQIEPNLESDTTEALAAQASLQDLGFQSAATVQPLRTIALDIRPDEEALLASMKEKWRYNIRLAARRGVVVRTAQTLDELNSWYALLETTGLRDQFGIHNLAYYQRFWKTFGSRQQVRLLLAYAGEELLAGIFVSVFAGEAIYLYGASGNARRNLMPNYLLQWEAIRWAREAGAHSYDFWGIPATDDAGEEMAGVFRFKSGWGGRIVTFTGNYEYVYHPLALSLARKYVLR